VLQPEAAPSREGRIRRELAQLKTERARLVNAVALGGELDDLIETLRERDQRRQELEEVLHACQSRPATTAVQLRHMLMVMEGLANGWRQVLREEPEHARPIPLNAARGPRDVHADRSAIMDARRERDALWSISGQIVRGWHVPNGIRTRVLALKGPRPGPLDDGDPQAQPEILP
jgi:hypothetical protein